MSDLPNGWIDASFGHVFDFKGGSQPPKATFSDHHRPGYVRLLQIRDFESDAKAVFIKDHSRWPKCSVNDIMIGRYGASVGKILSGKSGAYNVALVKMIFEREFLDPSWVRLFLLSDYFQKPLKRISRSAQNGFNKADLDEIEVPLAPLAEQRRIVAKIDSLSAKSKRARDQLDHIPRLVERYKQAILAAAFRGEITREWRQRNREVASWQNVVLQDIAEIQSGITLGKKRAATSHLIKRPYLRVANVQRGWLDLTEIKKVDVTEQEATRLYLRPGDILMNEGGDRDKLGRGWVWEGQIENCIHQNHVFRIRLLDDTFPPKLISLYANEFGQIHFFDEGKQTTNLASISKTKLSSLPLPLPPVNEAVEMLRCIDTAFAWVDRLASETTSARKLIDHLDQAILAKAFRGELVPQDPNDEPASVLLERIRAERQAAPRREKQKNPPQGRTRALRRH